MARGPKAELIEKVRCKHVGKWIGLKGTSVVVVSDTNDAIYKRLKEKGIDGVTSSIAYGKGKGVRLSFPGVQMRIKERKLINPTV